MTPQILRACRRGAVRVQFLKNNGNVGKKTPLFIAFFFYPWKLLTSTGDLEGFLFLLRTGVAVVRSPAASAPSNAAPPNGARNKSFISFRPLHVFVAVLAAESSISC